MDVGVVLPGLRSTEHSKILSEGSDKFSETHSASTSGSNVRLQAVHKLQIRSTEPYAKSNPDRILGLDP